ncbi:hypothetical protein [Blastococcus capsensis]|uniref:hypothetical protein n=1 Tax=Blastococcus capsensis TaxID=1564163 RepID=UPI002541EAD0|nr:hypothetical protein [Blastococcus capsensis]MDK3255246.1 hypothetical protein [Blastococcus capsensis]
MHRSDAYLRLRPPAWARAWLVVFPLLLAGLFLSPLPLRGDEDAVVPQVLVVGASAALAARMLVMGATGTPDGRLVVRNQLTTRTFSREQIAEVVVDRVGGFGRGWAAWLRLHDGSRHHLDVTRVPFRAFFGAWLERDAEAVRAWVAARPGAALPPDTR